MTERLTFIVQALNLSEEQFSLGLARKVHHFTNMKILIRRNNRLILRLQRFSVPMLKNDREQNPKRIYGR